MRLPIPPLHIKMNQVNTILSIEQNFLDAIVVDFVNSKYSITSSKLQSQGNLVIRLENLLVKYYSCLYLTASLNFFILLKSVANALPSGNTYTVTSSTPNSNIIKEAIANNAHICNYTIRHKTIFY